MLYVFLFLFVLVLVSVVPQILAGRRSFTIARATMKSHQDSIKLGMKLERYKIVAVVLAVILLAKAV